MEACVFSLDCIFAVLIGGVLRGLDDVERSSLFLPMYYMIPDGYAYVRECLML
jgi:hypothetical protein